MGAGKNADPNVTGERRNCTVTERGVQDVITVLVKGTSPSRVNA
jgi:hypothetical protein